MSKASQTSEKRHSVVFIRITKTANDKLRQLAKKRDLTISDLVRFEIEHLIASQDDPQASESETTTSPEIEQEDEIKMPTKTKETCTEVQVKKIKFALLKAKEVVPDIAVRMKAFLKKFGLNTIRELSKNEADDFLEALNRKLNEASGFDWIAFPGETPPSGQLVMTKIDNEEGCRNFQRMKFYKSMWWLADNSMAYYHPTHWAFIR